MRISSKNVIGAIACVCPSFLLLSLLYSAFLRAAGFIFQKTFSAAAKKAVPLVGGGGATRFIRRDLAAYAKANGRMKYFTGRLLKKWS